MKLLGRETRPELPVFPDLKFEFADTPGVEFDLEVAQELAERVAQRDGGRANHAHASSFYGVRIGIEDHSAAFEELDDAARWYTTDIILPSHVLQGAANREFGREFQRALDEREFGNRMSIPGSLGMFAVVAAIPTGMAAAIQTEGGLTTQEALVSAGVGLAGTAALIGKPTFSNIYRRRVTNPENAGVQSRHLAKAGDFASSLDLSPLVIPKPA